MVSIPDETSIRRAQIVLVALGCLCGLLMLTAVAANVFVLARIGFVGILLILPCILALGIWSWWLFDFHSADSTSNAVGGNDQSEQSEA
jgi:uncharacterized membrane protein YdfJ with MMPL/SSD domain